MNGATWAEPRSKAVDRSSYFDDLGLDINSHSQFVAVVLASWGVLMPSYMLHHDWGVVPSDPIDAEYHKLTPGRRDQLSVSLKNMFNSRDRYRRATHPEYHQLYDF